MTTGAMQSVLPTALRTYYTSKFPAYPIVTYRGTGYLGISARPIDPVWMRKDAHNE